jgi:hypothetical protein
VDAEIVFRTLNSEFGKEDVRHVPVEVLACVNKYFFKAAALAQYAGESSGLDELRPCTNHRNDP